MSAQKQLLGAGSSILAFAGALGSIKAKLSKIGSDKAKKGYEKAANTKKENNELIKKNIEQVTEKKAPQPFGELARTEEEIPTEPVKANTELEKTIVENKKQVKGFEGLKEEQAPKQKFILSEEGAYFPIKAENTETKIPVDEDVKGLVEVKQKNLKRAAAGKNNADKKEKLLSLYAKKHKGNYDYKSLNKFLDEFGFSKSAADYKSVGLDKFYLNSNAISKAEEQGEGMPGFINTVFNGMVEKYKDDKAAVEYLELKRDVFQNKHGNVSWMVDSEDDASDNVINKFDWQQLVIDTDELVDDMKSGKYKEFMKKYNGTGDDSKPENWYDNFTRDTGTYKVWDDTEEELPETDRSFSGIVF